MYYVQRSILLKMNMSALLILLSWNDCVDSHILNLKLGNCGDRAEVFTAVIIVPVVTYMVQWYTCKYEFKLIVHFIVLNSDLYSVTHIYLKSFIPFYLHMFCPQNSVLVWFFYIYQLHCYGDTREFDFSSWWPLCHVSHGCINDS